MKREHGPSEALQQAILSGLDLLPIAFLILDESGRILVANRTARRMMQLEPSLQTRHLSKIVRELLSRSVDETPVPAALTVPRLSGKPLSILVLPVHRGDSREAIGPTSVVFLGDPDLDAEPAPGLLTAIFGFTPAESKVASLVMRGKTVEEVAGKLGISPHTTRNHLKRLFSKTNTKRQSDLVHLLLTSPACLNLM